MSLTLFQESAHAAVRPCKGLKCLYTRSIFILMQAQRECPRWEKKLIRIQSYRPCGKWSFMDGRKKIWLTFLSSCLLKLSRWVYCSQWPNLVEHEHCHPWISSPWCSDSLTARPLEFLKCRPRVNRLVIWANKKSDIKEQVKNWPSSWKRNQKLNAINLCRLIMCCKSHGIP